MVEAKCIEVDSKQAAATVQNNKEVPRLNNEQWQALIALHRTLLHEHHDFFLASQHPSAAPSLRKLASKYAMPARMWRHGIHSFLELLRHRLPESFEHMLAFIYLAYSMMALLYETVPVFADTWVECLGDLGRYRMAIEEGDPRDREVWMNVSRFWYSKGTDRLPHVGRLYHHLAILSRPNILQQLFFYCKALAVYQPFSAARESILTLFDPAALKEQDVEGTQSADAVFVLLHSICFTCVNQDAFEDKKAEYLDLLDKKIGSSKTKFKIPGVYIAICGVASLFQYNNKNSRMKAATSEKENQKATAEAEMKYKSDQQAKSEPDNILPPGPVVDNYDRKLALQTALPELDLHLNSDIALGHSQDLAFSILSLAFERDNDAAVQPHIHVFLVFLNYLKEYPEGMALIVKAFPWESMVQYATRMIRRRKDEDNTRIMAIDEFPMPNKGFRPLPEEYQMRGLEIARRFFPYGYFQRVQVDDDERLHEFPSMNLIREEKILWLLMKFAASGPWIHYDPGQIRFRVSLELKAILDEHKKQPLYEHMFIADDSDIEMDMSPATMAEDDEESIDEEQNPEIWQLLMQRNNLRQQLNDPVTPMEDVTKTKELSTAFTADSFKPNHTVVVVDTNSLVKRLDVFETMLASNQWHLVIPYSVVTELHGLHRNENSKVSSPAEAALNSLEQAIRLKKNIRIITAKNSAVTNISGQFKELIDDYREEGGKKNLDDIIIGTAKAQGEMVAKRTFDDGVTRPVVLVTDDTVMRVKAITRGVASVGTKQWIKHMSQPDNAQKRKFAVTFHALSTKYPVLDENKVWEAVVEAGGDEISATTLLKKEQMSAKKKRMRATTEGFQGSLLS